MQVSIELNPVGKANFHIDEDDEVGIWQICNLIDISRSHIELKQITTGSTGTGDQKETYFSMEPISLHQELELQAAMPGPQA